MIFIYLFLHTYTTFKKKTKNNSPHSQIGVTHDLPCWSEVVKAVWARACHMTNFQQFIRRTFLQTLFQRHKTIISQLK